MAFGLLELRTGRWRLERSGHLCSCEVVCDLLARESHQWVYVCNDKERGRAQSCAKAVLMAGWGTDSRDADAIQWQEQGEEVEVQATRTASLSL